MKDWKILEGNCLEVLKGMEDNSIDCCVTSPPYYALRDYGTGHWEGGDPNCPHKRLTKIGKDTKDGHMGMYLQGEVVGDAIYKTVCPLCGAVRVDEQIGLEETPEEYIQKLVDVFHEVKRVLKDDGTLWVNIGDSYASNTHTNHNFDYEGGRGSNNDAIGTTNTIKDDVKNKDLIGIPWMLAFALRKDGWYLRQDIIWCLSGGAYIYVKSQHGVMPMMVRELARLDFDKVELWNGSRWVKINGFQESTSYGDKIELTLRSGERIGCTDGHRWILKDGTEVLAKDLKVGDILKSVDLPDCGEHDPGFLTDDALWLLGLYLAEGSRSEDIIQISLNSKEFEWYEKIQKIVEFYGGSSTYTLDGNSLDVRIYSKVINSMINQYIGGKTAKDKHLNNICWKLSNDKLKCLLSGYFDGDGYYEEGRIRLGFTRNYYLERDLRTSAARLGATLTLNLATSMCEGKEFKTFRGEWRWERSGHFNEKDRCEIVKIGKSKARHFYDISVDSDDHTYALASGVLTHNCKSNPMPESVKDRFTKSHEYLFLLTKSPNYYFNDDNAMEIATGYDGRRDTFNKGSKKYGSEEIMPDGTKQELAAGGHERWKFVEVDSKIKFGGNKYGDSDDKHYQTYSGNTYKVKYKNLQYDGQQPNSMHIRRAEGYEDDYYPVRKKRDVWTVSVNTFKEAHFATFPEKLIEPCIQCGCKPDGVVLDPFNGSGTTGLVALKNDMNYVGIELNPKYIEMSEKRINSYLGKEEIEVADEDGNIQSVKVQKSELF